MCNALMDDQVLSSPNENALLPMDDVHHDECNDLHGHIRDVAQYDHDASHPYNNEHHDEYLHVEDHEDDIHDNSRDHGVHNDELQLQHAHE